VSYELRVVSYEFEYQDLSIEYQDLGIKYQDLSIKYQDLRSKEEERLNTKAPIPSLRGTKQTLEQIKQILKINPSFPCKRGIEYQDLSIKYQDLRSKEEESPKTKYQSTNSVIARHEANFGANSTNTKDKSVIPVKTGIFIRLVTWVSVFSVYDTQSTR
jgi:carboxypeptidase C (cathepsin A)